MARIDNIQVPLDGDVAIEKELYDLFNEEIEKTGRKKKDIGIEAFMFYFKNRDKIDLLEQNTINNDETNKKLDELIHIIKNLKAVTSIGTEQKDKSSTKPNNEISNGIDFGITADDLDGIV